MPISKYNLPSFFNQLCAFFAIDSYAANPLFFAYNAILGSCRAPLFMFGSFFAMYGGFDTMISYLSDMLGACSNDACFVRILSANPNVLILRRATRRAAWDLSIAVPCAFLMFFTNAQIMHPVPVPKSNIFTGVSSILSDMTAETNVSVSGRGSKVWRLV